MTSTRTELSTQQTTLKVALLRGDDFHNLYLERLLGSRFEITAVVSEPGRAQRRAIWRNRRWKDGVAAEYHRFRRSIIGKNRYRKRYFDPVHDNFSSSAAPRALEVADINDPRVGSYISASGPEVCLITCTTKLSETTIRTIGVPIINIHGGHLPDYRGCHCFFMAINDGRFDAIGSTIHFVDAGLDTGDIIEIARPTIRPTDDAERLYSRAERLAAQRLVHWLEELENGRPIPRKPQAFRGRLVLRRHRTPRDDIAHWLRRRSGRLQIPAVTGSLPDHPWDIQPADDHEPT